MIFKQLNWSDAPFSASYTSESPPLAAAYSSQSWEGFLRLARLCIPRHMALICLLSLTKLLPSSWSECVNSEGTAVPHLSSLEGRAVWGGQMKWEPSLSSFQNIVFYCDEMLNVKCTFVSHIPHSDIVCRYSTGLSDSSCLSKILQWLVQWLLLLLWRTPNIHHSNLILWLLPKWKYYFITFILNNTSTGWISQMPLTTSIGVANGFEFFSMKPLILRLERFLGDMKSEHVLFPRVCLLIQRLTSLALSH